MINIYLLISLSFLAGSVITGLILWGKLRGAIDKSIRLETESNLKELSVAAFTQGALNSLSSA